ncbi:MAG: hypothetical protein WCF46_12115, partial [Nitrososphaeraceae archaeon]
LQYVKSDIFSLQEGTPNLTTVLYTRFEGKPVPVYFVHLLFIKLDEDFLKIRTTSISSIG